MRNLPRARKRLLGLGLVAVLIGAGAAVAVAVAGGRSTSLSFPTKTGAGASKPYAWVSTSSSLPPPTAAAVALSRVVASLKGRRVRSVLVSARLGTPPPYARSAADAHAAVSALYVTVKISGKSGGALEPLWEADLLEGAIAELAGKSRSLGSAVGYADFSGQLPGGKVIPDLDEGGLGSIARGQQFAGAHESGAAIRHSVERVASAFGLSVDSVTVFRALGAAPAVVLTAPDISTVASKFGSLENAFFGSRPRYEGYYLEIRGENGKTYIRRSASYLTGSFQLWTDPSLRR